MSRTDKDDPFWVSGRYAARRTANHDRNCDSDPQALTRYWRPGDGTHPCDLNGPGPGQRGWGHPGCYWYDNSRDYYTINKRPGVRDLHDQFYDPERAHVRDTLRLARRDFNANGETSIEPINRQNRRSTWCGGYWD